MVLGMEENMNSGIVRPPTLAVVVAENIREAVFRGTLKQGERLQEIELSRTYNVSRGTIREALRLLQDDGMVRIFPHRGALVSKLTARTIGETYSLRILLEAYAVEQAITKKTYTKQVLATLQALLSQMEKLRKTGDYYQTMQVDFQFHNQLCSPCDHHMLMEALRTAQTSARLCMATLTIVGSKIPADPRQHRPILKAVQEGDVKEARQALTFHLEQTRDELLALMEKGNSNGGRLAAAVDAIAPK